MKWLHRQERVVSALERYLVGFGVLLTAERRYLAVDPIITRASVVSLVLLLFVHPQKCTGTVSSRLESRIFSSGREFSHDDDDDDCNWKVKNEVIMRDKGGSLLYSRYYKLARARGVLLMVQQETRDDTKDTT